jgi:hypothetical protein
VDNEPATRPNPPQPPAAATVAVAFGYPDPSRVSKIEQVREREWESSIVWSRTYRSNDYSFAATSIALLSAGGYLTAERKKELTAQIVEMLEENAKHKRPDGAPGMVAGIAHEFDLSGGRKGFAHLVGFGPGGEGHRAVAPSPDGKYELLLSVHWSYEGSDQFQITDDTEAYAEKLQVGTNLLLEQAVRELDAALFGEFSNTEEQ